jgi:hypothetical protein
MKYTILIPALFLFVACHQGKPQQAATTDSVPVSNKPYTPTFAHATNEHLKQYDRYLNDLDTQNIDNATLAVEKFETLFQNETPDVCDTAYYLFEHYHGEGGLMISHIFDGDTLQAFLPGGDDGTTPPKLNATQQQFLTHLQKNGYSIGEAEGSAYLQQDYDYMEKHFAAKVTPLMRKYIAQQKIEQKEGFAMDAGLTIDEITLAKRGGWWEAFNKANPDFIYNESADYEEKEILSVMLTGMDNTPVTDNDTLDAFYRTSYNYVIDSLPNTNMAAIIRPLRDAYDHHNKKAVKKIIDSCEENHLMIWDDPNAD